jgi:hypothetical protein
MAKFDYFNDPTSYPTDINTTFTIKDDKVIYKDLTVINSGESKPEIDLYIPFIWVRLGENPDTNKPNDYIPLKWNNGKDGWYTKDFADTGTSLLVTTQIIPTDAPDTPNGEVAAGKVAADNSLSEVNILQLSRPDANSENLEVLHRGDKVPFVNLGSFDAGQAKNYDLVYTFDWGGDHPDTALRVSGFGFTIVPTDQHVHDHSADYFMV